MHLHFTKRFLFSIVALVLISGSLLPAVAQESGEHAHWTYEGEEGPEFWGEIDPQYSLCAVGRAQSPIDIAGGQGVDLQDITFNYQPSTIQMVNNGHTIQVSYDAGSSITYNETDYALLQFHFHHPSEHTLAGETFDMELHLVHQDTNGGLAVVGVLLQAGEETNQSLAPIFDNLPTTANEAVAIRGTINAADFLPAEHLYYTYTGSLTTPPCTQGVRWLVLQEPVEISAEQMEAFAALFEMNARPVQPLNNRDLLADASAAG